MHDPEVNRDIWEQMYPMKGAMVFLPLTTANPDGTWTAHYPEADWSVTGATEQDARQRLAETAITAMPDDFGAPWKAAAVRAHLDHGPIPGVYALTAEQHIRVKTSADPEAELNKVIAEIEATRTQT